MTTLAARLAPWLPARLTAATARALYPRFEPELARLSDMVPSGGTAVDVGGWYGPWTHRLAARARQVVTLEPVPHLARTLAASAPANVRVVRAAAGDRHGTALLWQPPDDERGERGVSSLVRRAGLHAASGHPVPCVTLDELALHDVDFVKIDVDGAELPVLRGAHTLLTRDRPALFIELETRIQPIAPVIGHLRALGYEGWVLPGRSWLPLPSFDLAAHQRGAAHLAAQGLLRRALTPAGRRPRYVNSVLFLPEGRAPGAVRGHGADDVSGHGADDVRGHESDAVRGPGSDDIPGHESGDVREHGSGDLRDHGRHATPHTGRRPR
ncbi:FkbM family methyltransferase [Streptomyces sp. VRA16 Mangrove soil]|uniref:FkbM family methyltransferase n=1 Tax=Streptomyces sp. VRA16 Mangrove soil TaxID=2817434 RepID=UPI001A9F332E|nr:FkbM family methyltransferase [Streptomyces sp. VRA16 Mangrove soil]MBO1336854.1 FkbM family methyltransferase [Streptomyces sp. VRA16 Mangrove soil]